jgi:ABC-type multidrug transport system fused ATPase/permease subunit
MAAAPVVPASPAPTPETAPLSEGSRIINTFIAPSKTFSDLRTRTSWWSWVAPWLVLAIASTIFAYAVGQKVGFARAGENVLQTRPKQYDRIQNMNAADRDKTMQAVENQTRIGTYAFPVIDLIILLIVAAVLLGSFTFGANAQVSYKTCLAIVVYASLPGVLRFLLATVTLFAGISPDSFNVQNPVATNLGVLFSATDAPVLYTAGSFIDLFAIWTLVLTAIGFTCVSKVKRGTALAIVFAWYIVFGLVMVGITAAFA